MKKKFELHLGMFSANRLTAARSYIKAGVKVVLTHGIDQRGCCTCYDPGCQHPGKHPLARFFPHGANSATDDISLVRRALRCVSEANIAITLDHLTVLDIDGPVGRAVAEALSLPETIAVETGRGEHRYFVGTLPCGAFKAQEIDVSGPNRFVMVPPSRHESGKEYLWLRRKVGQAQPVPLVLQDLRAKPRSNSGQQRKRMIPIGERNDTLFRTACGLRRWVGDDDTLFDMMAIMNDRLCREPLKESELHSAISSSARYSEAREELFGPVVDHEPLPMEWIWYPYIPRFGLTILAGDPGKGKSLLTALLIGILTSGACWPLSSDRCPGRRVLVLSAEDNWQHVTLARVRKAGADLDNLHRMYKFRALTPERLELLRQEIEEWRPDLVIIDTLSAYMGAACDMHRQNEVGEFLAELTEIAESVRCGILAIAHLNKQSGEHPIYRVVGSIGFVASIRSALFLGKDPENENQLALAHGKSNAAPKGQTITFEIVGGGRDDVPRLQAVSFSDATEHDVCRVERNRVGRPDDERQDAIEFVLEYLSERPAPVTWESVLEAAERRSIASRGTIDKVRTELAKAGKIIQVGKARNARWERASDGDNDESA
jgi:AAA domain/Bifunctional DNA primase/polymerase, N-terminal/Primase C terminal 1 (PriCT-1)